MNRGRNLLLLACLLMPVLCVAATDRPRPVVAGYVFPQDAVLTLGQIDARSLTRVNYAFANIKDGRMVTGFAHDAENYAFLTGLKKQNPSLTVLVSVGGWALAMRGMMVTTMGEDYVTFAEAKGLRSVTIFTRYCIRNAILPQTTGLALALGQILSGAVLVEVVFGYPGIGALLFQAIEENDFFLIQGIVFTVIVALGFATFLLDIFYPLLDPRISYRRG